MQRPSALSPRAPTCFLAGVRLAVRRVAINVGPGWVDCSLSGMKENARPMNGIDQDVIGHMFSFALRALQYLALPGFRVGVGRASNPEPRSLT